MARVHVPIRLRWADLDAYGHVNNAVLLRLLEEARIQAFWSTDEDLPSGFLASDTSMAVIDGSGRSNTLTLIGRQEIEYLAPIPYLRSPIDIQMWLGHLGGASISVCYEIWSPENQAEKVLYAVAETAIVLVDSKMMKPRRMTDEERAALEPFVEAPVSFKRR